MKLSLDSLINQTNPNWKAIVVADGTPFPEMDEKYKQDKRITFLEPLEGKRKGQGYTRNRAMQTATTKWVSFLDDDDTVHADYVKYLQEHLDEHENLDTVVFRMRLHDQVTKILPRPPCVRLSKFSVGISFSVNMEFLREKNLYFQCNFCEDFDLLNRIRSNRGKMLLSRHVVYYVRKAGKNYQKVHDVLFPIGQK